MRIIIINNHLIIIRNKKKMKYYLFSFVITVVIFAILQYFEYSKKNQEKENNPYYEPYDFFSTNNYLLFGIIYIVTTIGAYYLYSSEVNLTSMFNFTKKTGGGGTVELKEQLIKEEINPQVLSKINDNFDIGIDPFNSDDNSSISSLSSAY